MSSQGPVDRNLINDQTRFDWKFDLKFWSNQVNNDHTRFDQLDFGPIGLNVNLRLYHTVLWCSKPTKNVMKNVVLIDLI